jgi:hypothetical protein
MLRSIWTRPGFLALTIAAIAIAGVVLFAVLAAAEDGNPPPCCEPGVEAPPPYLFEGPEDIEAANQLPEPERSRMLRIIEEGQREKFQGVIGPFSVVGEGANITLSCPGKAAVEQGVYTASLQSLMPRDRVQFTDCSLTGTPQNTGWNIVQAFLYDGSDPVEVPLVAPRDRLTQIEIAGKPALAEHSIGAEFPSRLVVIARQPNDSASGILLLVDAYGSIEDIAKALEPTLQSY